jgi:hypothetical protein
MKKNEKEEKLRHEKVNVIEFLINFVVCLMV